MFNHIWSQTNITFVNANWTWAEKELVQEFVSGGKLDETAYNIWQQKNPEKKKAIQLLCKINNIKFDETKDYKDIKLTIKDARVLAKAVLGINITINDIK